MNELSLFVIFLGFAVLCGFVAYLDYKIRKLGRLVLMLRGAMKAHSVELTKAADLIHKLVEIEQARPE